MQREEQRVSDDCGGFVASCLNFASALPFRNPSKTMSFLSIFTRAPSSLVRPVTRSLSVSAQLFQDARSKVLFVGGLSYDTSRAALQEPFQEYGHVESTRIITDRATGRSKGWVQLQYLVAKKADRLL
jgi:hypothetical protein